MVWPALGLAKARLIAKSLKGQLGAIQYKKSKSTTGKKTPKTLAELFKRLHEHASRSSGSTDPLQDDSLHAQSSVAGSSKETVQSASSSSCAQAVTKESIAALYGWTSNPPEETVVIASQVTITDGEMEVERESVQAVDLESPGKAGGNEQGEAAYWWDHATCCLKKGNSSRTSTSKMQAGQDGFAEAVFSDGEVVATEYSNLEVFPAITPVTESESAKKEASFCS